MNSRIPNVNRSRIHEDMVQRLAVDRLPDSDRSLFPTIRELLCFAALLGYSENRRLPLDKEKGVEDVSYQQFERVDAEDLIYLLALAESNDPSILNEGEEERCVNIFEEYANGGLQIINDAMIRSGGEYPDRDVIKLLFERGYLDSHDEEIDVSELTL